MQSAGVRIGRQAWLRASRAEQHQAGSCCVHDGLVIPDSVFDPDSIEKCRFPGQLNKAGEKPTDTVCCALQQWMPHCNLKNFTHVLFMGLHLSVAILVYSRHII